MLRLSMVVSLICFMVAGPSAAESGPDHGQRHRDRAALHTLRQTSAQRQLQPLVTRRQAKAQIERLAVDALDLPDPGDSLLVPIGPSKAGRNGRERSD